MRNNIEFGIPGDSTEERAYIQRITQLVKLDPHTTGKLMQLTDANVLQISPFVQQSRAFERQFKNNPNAAKNIFDTQVFIRSNMENTLHGSDLMFYYRWLDAHEGLRRTYLGFVNDFGEEWKDRIEQAVYQIFPIRNESLLGESDEI